MKSRDSEKILAFLEKISDSLVIVEGKKDVRALNTLNFKNILPINGKPLVTVAEMVVKMTGDHRYSDIIILSDFDSEGRRIAAKLSRLLRARKVHPNQRLRSRVMAIGFNKCEDIKLSSILRIGKSNSRK